MARIAGVAVATPCGDLDATIAALSDGTARPGRLNGEFLIRLIALGRDALDGRVPDLVLFATTKADLPAWCDDLLAKSSTGRGGPAQIARALGDALGSKAFAVSAACASGTVALGVGARAIALGDARRVLVIGGDRLAPFVSEGFTSLRAIDPSGCHPFDRERAGLQLGETAAAIVLEPSSEPGLHIHGWASSMDANHLTGPSRTGEGLARACKSALTAHRPALIVAHGTGTRYNDDSESLAYAAVFPEVPIVSYKGGLGHSLGACGVTEVALASAAARSHRTPGTLGLREAGCAGSVTILPQGSHRVNGEYIVCANAGFGGLNGVAVVGAEPPNPLSAVIATMHARIDFDHAGWTRTAAGFPAEKNVWRDPAEHGSLPMLGAREILGRIDASWGRMDLACRTLVALATLIAPLPEDAAIVLLSDSGCAATDRTYEQRRRSSGADPQLFAYTLPTTPVGETSIRLKIHGAGMTVLGASDADGRTLSRALLADRHSAVLLARLETDRTPHTAWAELWRSTQ
jgi:hypothetical protein